jgi:acyl-CoA reductase-like NAD-dependent aldehyde dehydrogenase
MRASYPYYLGNRAAEGANGLDVIDKFTGQVATTVALADSDTLDQAIAEAKQAQAAMRGMPAFARKAVLLQCVEAFKAQADRLAQSLCIEAGKPIKDSRGEVARLIDTFQIAAEESVRIGGEVLDLEISPRAAGYRGMYRRFPIGVCGFISPFNFPLNLAAHKVAAAIAAGCPFILKPASRTPVGALQIGEILAQTDLPPGAFSILPCSRSTADQLVTDPRIKLLSFTGSPDVGWDMKARCGKKEIVLELGGNAACIVDHDANLDDATERIMIGAFYQSGQSCIGVQRILIHRNVYEDMKQRLIKAALELPFGDPKLETTFIGPMIDVSEAKRMEAWIQEAIAAGGSLLCGGTRDGAMIPATLLEHVPQDQPLCAKEAFGPVAVLQVFDSFDEAINLANDSVYGLQAGVFTRDHYKVQQAWDELEVGGVVIGDVPSWRVDHMPYGGVKDSGLGREGIRYAIESMTEIRLLITRMIDP